METQKILRQYYETYDEDHRLCSRYGMVEYLTTMRYIEKYLRPGMQILEIGAATGRYSHTLAQRGYSVDAIELVEHNIEIFQAHTQPDETVTITQGNAKDLSAFSDDTYDITLLLGPMYHLFTEEEKMQALSEAIRVTKCGGILFSAYCMADASVLSYGFVQGKIHEILKKCMVDPVTFQTFSKPWDLFELYRKEDIDSLRNLFPVTQLHFVASDGYANHMRDTMSEMDDATFDLFMRYHFATCERPDMVGLSHHTLDIMRKEEQQ
ncbi:MAG: class I SAM-dependent methyltransferase [Oscillospiraceae bacterium]|nr:class I SAM-dependent methyltransferase [Oscillospiraceae bacterium]